MLLSKTSGIVLLAILFVASTAMASSLDDLLADFNDDAGHTPGVGNMTLLFNQLVGFNTELALDVYGVPKPNVPSATIQAGDDLVRAFKQAGGSNSGISGFDPVLWDGPDNNTHGVGFKRFGLAQDAVDWFGLAYDKKQVNVTDVLTVQDLIDQVGTSYFGYTFDQNQTNSNDQADAKVLPDSWENGTPDADGAKLNVLVDGVVTPTAEYTPEIGGDIWIKGRAILIDPDELASWQQGIYPGQAGMTPEDFEAFVQDLIDNDPTKVVILEFDDTVFGDYPEDDEFYDVDTGSLDPSQADRDWAHLPGKSFYDLNDLDTTYFDDAGTADEYDNNGDAAHGDWAGFFLDGSGDAFDYAPYSDWGYVLEMQGLYDEAGKEEVYIFNLGEPTEEPPPTGVVPEPLTMFGVAGALAGLGAYIKRRR